MKRPLAGLRVFDIKDLISPKETGWFIPPPPLKRYGPQPPNDLVQQHCPDQPAPTAK
jgi:hypothetical protein